jgi:hypothetical protein
MACDACDVINLRLVESGLHAALRYLNSPRCIELAGLSVKFFTRLDDPRDQAPHMQ